MYELDSYLTSLQWSVGFSSVYDVITSTITTLSRVQVGIGKLLYLWTDVFDYFKDNNPLIFRLINFCW